MDRATVSVVKDLIRLNPQLEIRAGDKIFRPVNILLGGVTLTIRGANNLTTGRSTTGNQNRNGARPMICLLYTSDAADDS